MGKQRASARLAPLYTLRTTEEADWLMLLWANKVCRYAHKLFVLVIVVYFVFLCRSLDFRCYGIVNIFCKLRYINVLHNSVF